MAQLCCITQVGRSLSAVESSFPEQFVLSTFLWSFRNFTQLLNTFVDFSKLHTHSNAFPCEYLSRLFHWLHKKLSTNPDASLCPILKEILGDLKTAYHFASRIWTQLCSDFAGKTMYAKEIPNMYLNQLLSQNSLDKPLFWAINSPWETRQLHMTWCSSQLRTLSWS